MAFVLLNYAWLWTWRFVLSGATATAWTALCVWLFIVLWTPTDRNPRNVGSSWDAGSSWMGCLDQRCWPYKGVSESSVSLTPVTPIYSRITIREEAEANRYGYLKGSFRPYNHPSGLTKLTYTLELEPIADANPDPKQVSLQDQKRQIVVDALKGMNWREVSGPYDRRSGVLLDATIVTEWLRYATSGQKATDEQLSAHARALVAVIHDAADESSEEPYSPSTLKLVSRLHNAAARRLQSVGQERNFRVPFNYVDNVKWEPTVHILYVGVPLMLVVWGVGLWLLRRRRVDNKKKSEVDTGNVPQRLPPPGS